MQSRHRDKFLSILVGHNKSYIFATIAEILLITNTLKKEFPENCAEFENERAETLTAYIIDKYNKGDLVIPPELIPVTT